MRATKLLCCAALAGVTVLVNSAGRAAEPRTEKQGVDGKALANSLLEVGGDHDAWFRSAGLLAWSLQIGIPEAKFRRAHPGAEFENLPIPVLDALHQHVDAIGAWSACLGDERRTRIVENDLFGGGSSKNAKRITCEQAASVIVASLLPAKLLTDTGNDQAKNRELVGKAAAEWANRLRGKAADERMKAWFEAAGDDQRRLFLALTIQMEHAPAYSLLEASFVERAAAADAFFYLELSAYLRHRRAKGKKLLGQLEPVLRKQPFADGPPEQQEFFFEVWKLLTDYDTLEAAIADWQAGRLEFSKLAELLERSIDQPWAYHSMGVEPVSVFRPTMEQNLKSLVASAVGQQELVKRILLLELGSEAAHLLKVIVARTNKIERNPAPRSDAADWRQLVTQLNQLFKDDRVRFDGISLTTPGQSAADIVWELWKPNEQEYDSNQNLLRDWRLDSLNSLIRTARSLRIPAAEYFLTKPDGVNAELYPEREAMAIAGRFADGDAAAWRKQLDSLPWNERLMLLAEAKRDPMLAFRMWPRLTEFVEFSGVADALPESFASLWRDMLAGKKLNDATWQALQGWIAAEARGGRYWTVAGEASPVRPGISLYVFHSSPEGGNTFAVPVLRTGLRGDGISLFTRSESFRIAGDELEEFVAEKDRRFQNLPRPIEAIMEQHAKQEGDEDLCSDGFTLHMTVSPPQK